MTGTQPAETDPDPDPDPNPNTDPTVSRFQEYNRSTHPPTNTTGARSMSDLLRTATLANIDGDIVPVLAISFGCGIAIVAIIFGTVKSMVINSNREKTRREVAAYVAEGSITPEDAEKILSAGRQYEGPGKC